jgi:hypothetical protein
MSTTPHLAQAAQRAALQELRRRHIVEYKEIYRAESLKRGGNPHDYIARIARLKAELARLENKSV